MDTFNRSIVDSAFARMVAGVLLDSTQNSGSITSAELAGSIGFLDSVEAAVDESLAAHPIVKSTGKARERETVRDGIVLERKGLLSLFVGLGAFDGLLMDDNGNPVSFTSRIGINGGFARVGDLPLKTEKKEGEKKGKNPDAWKRVPPAFVERMKRLIETMTANGTVVTREELVVALMQDAGREGTEFIKSGDYTRWQGWIADTREGNPALQDDKHRPLYISNQGRTGGMKRAEYPVEVAPTVSAETVATTEAAETVSAEEVIESESLETASDDSDQTDDVESEDSESDETASDDSETEFAQS